VSGAYEADEDFSIGAFPGRDPGSGGQTGVSQPGEPFRVAVFGPQLPRNPAAVWEVSTLG